MTPYGSTALFRRDDAIVFKRPRKERPTDVTQARKAASRFWISNAAPGEKLIKVILARAVDGRVEISERAPPRDWSAYHADPAAAARETHLAALLAELGVSPNDAPAAVPDVLVINGFTYRRDI